MNKEQFYFQYFGQSVLSFRNWVGTASTHEVCAGNLPFYLDDILEPYLSLRSIGQLTDEQCHEIGKSIGLVHAQVVERDAECIFIVDDSYSIGLYSTGVITMYKGNGLHLKPYWNDIKSLYDAVIGHGICLDETAVREGWAVIEPDKTVKEDK